MVRNGESKTREQGWQGPNHWGPGSQGRELGLYSKSYSSILKHSNLIYTFLYCSIIGFLGKGGRDKNIRSRVFKGFHNAAQRRYLWPSEVVESRDGEMQIQEWFRKWTRQELWVVWVGRGGCLGEENSGGRILSLLWVLNGKCSGGLMVFLLEVLTFAATTPMVVQSQVLSWLHFLIIWKVAGQEEGKEESSA